MYKLENEMRKIIGERIRELRKENGYTQEKLADILGLKDRSTLANWEIGRVSIDVDTLGKLADLFGVTPNFFFMKTDVLNKTQPKAVKIEIIHGLEKKAGEIKEHLKVIEKIVNDMLDTRKI